MSKQTMRFRIFSCAVLAAGSAMAQEAPAAGGGASLSTGDGAKASMETSGAAPADGSAFEPYEEGYPPEGNVLEIGIFGGVLFPSPIHQLRNHELYPTHYKYNSGLEGGGRLGYYPLSWVGIEGEGMGASSKVKGVGDLAVLFGYRGFLVVQAPTPYVAPFLVGGYGRLGAVSHAMGGDVDQGWMFGAGAKIPMTHILGLRVDFRDNLTPNKHLGKGQGHSFELQLGLSATIERSRKEPPPPPPDSDHDGVGRSDGQVPERRGRGARWLPDGHGRRRRARPGRLLPA